MKKITSLLTAVTTIFSASLFAQTSSTVNLVEYDFTTGLEPTHVAPGVSAEPVSIGQPFPGLTESNAGHSTVGGDLFVRGMSGAERLIRTTEDAAINQGTFFEFTITPDEGKALDLTGFSATIGGQVLGGHDKVVPDFTEQYFLRVNLDGYATNVATGAKEVKGLEVGGRTANPVKQEMTGQFSESMFEGVTSAVTFRLYFYIETDNTSFYQVFRMDDITLVGRVVAN